MLPLRSPVCWALLIAPTLLASLPGRAGAENALDKPVLHPPFELLDENGVHVLKSGLPYSSAKSCDGAGCHDYKKISRAFHFQQGREETHDGFGRNRGDQLPQFGKLGLPSLVGPGYFGGYNCMQGNQTGVLAKKSNANVADFGEWGAAGFLKACSTCHAGGGWAERDRDGIRYDQKDPAQIAALDGDYYERDSSTPEGIKQWDWKKSGVREVDCLTCHIDFSSLTKFPSSQLGKNDGSDKTASAYTHWGILQDTQFVQKGFFRYANSAILEFLNLRPDSPNGLQLLTVDRTITPKTANPNYTLNLDATGLPRLNWNPDAFDARGRVVMPMLYFPGNDNCMMCHLASSGINRISSGKAAGSRRGFTGFGAEALQVLGADGKRQPDFKDDVHKGKVWTEPNGESREIQNCNACHSKEYYKPAYSAVNLSPDHQFPRGNTDSDIRRDLSNHPAPLECDYCHDQAANPALPRSGQKTALAAHRELWKAAGYLTGYAPTTYDRVVQVHFDKISCQSCHITKVGYNDKASDEIHYRNRIDHDGKLRTIPYKPHNRYYSQDIRSGRILSRYETQSVLARKTDGSGKAYGAIIDPDTQQEIGKVSINAMGQLGDPVGYEDYKAWKQALDKVLTKKGYANPDVRFVYTETNEYMLNHQTRPSVEAVPCGDCHDKKETGAFSSAVSPTGIFGDQKTLKVGALPDRRLVDEGLFILAKPYHRVDDKGNIVENVGAVLKYTEQNPSMTVFNMELDREIGGAFKQVEFADALKFTGISGATGEKIASAIKQHEWLVFNSAVGDKSLKGMALILPSDEEHRGLTDEYRVSAESREVGTAERKALKKAGRKKYVSDIYSLRITDANRNRTTNLGSGDLIIKLPYQGSQVKPKKVAVMYSGNGKSWKKLPSTHILDFVPVNPEGGGYVAVRVNGRQYPKLSANLAVAD